MERTPGERFLSPSLAEPAGSERTAFELKFLVDETTAARAEAWAREQLTPDPHGDPALGGAYRTATLYLDTPNLDVFHRSPSFRRSKHRLRRYGDEPVLYLERKVRDGDRVRKQRSSIADGELELLAAPLSVTTWPGHWFHRRLLDRGLRPSALVVYRRTAFVGDGDGSYRLTLDRGLRGRLGGEWSVPAEEGGLPLHAGRVVLEMKFHAALPARFKGLIEELRLAPCPVSKYRTCLRAWGASDRREAADA